MTIAITLIVTLTNESIRVINKEDIIKLVTQFYSHLYKVPETMEEQILTPS